MVVQLQVVEQGRFGIGLAVESGLLEQLANVQLVFERKLTGTI